MRIAFCVDGAGGYTRTHRVSQLLKLHLRLLYNVHVPLAQGRIYERIVEQLSQRTLALREKEVMHRIQLVDRCSGNDRFGTLCSCTPTVIASKKIDLSLLPLRLAPLPFFVFLVRLVVVAQCTQQHVLHTL